MTICSPCEEKFESDDLYLAHTCPKADGAMPTSPDYLIRTTTPNFEKISENAQKRGEERLKEEEK